MVVACGLAACGHSRPTTESSEIGSDKDAPGAQTTRVNQNASLEDPDIRMAPQKGDIDGMAKRRQIRALVSLSKTTFFYDNGRPRGMAYDALVEFEKFLNRKLHPMIVLARRRFMSCLCPRPPRK